MKVLLSIILLTVIYYLLSIEWNHGHPTPPKTGMPICMGMGFCVMILYVIWNPHRRTFFM